MGIEVDSIGEFKDTQKWLENMTNKSYIKQLDQYGRRGVDALSAATPYDTGTTAVSWSYDIQETSSGVTINWYNSNVNDGVNIAIIIQYGHGTGTGGYVQGRDYINPALRPLFDQMSEAVRRVVTNG